MIDEPCELEVLDAREAALRKAYDEATTYGELTNIVGEMWEVRDRQDAIWKELDDRVAAWYAERR